MKISLRTKITLILLPMVAVVLFFLASTIAVYAAIIRDLERMRHEISAVVRTERLARTIEEYHKDWMDVLIKQGTGSVKPARKGKEIFRGWKKRLKDSAESGAPEDAVFVREIVRNINGVLRIEDRIEKMAEQAEGENGVASLFRSEMEPLLDDALIGSVDRYVAAKDAEIRRILPEMRGRVVSVGIFSSAVMGAHLRDLGLDVAMALEIEKFARTVTRQTRGYSEVLVHRNRQEVERVREAEKEGLSILSRWRQLVLSRPLDEKDREREIRVLEGSENEFLLVSRIGDRLLMMEQEGRRGEAKAPILENLDALLASLMKNADAIAAGEERNIADDLAAVFRAADVKKIELVLLSVLVLAVGVGSPWFLHRKLVDPILELKTMAARVGAGRLDTRVAIASSDEIGELADSFNAMTASLAGTTVSKDYLDSIIRSIVSGILVASPEGTVVTANAAACEMLGCHEREILGRPIASVFGMEEAAARDWFDGLVARENVRNVEMVWRAKEGNEVPVLFSGSVVRAADGAVSSVVCMGVDITDRITSEKALQEAHGDLQVWVRDLERRNREITELNRLGDMLQTCLKAEEAYDVIAASATELFPGCSGTLGIIHSSRNIVETRARWGPRGEGDAFFDPEECWALRRGRPHVMDSGGQSIACPHIGRPQPRCAICVPMVAQGETIGMIHLRFEPNDRPGGNDAGNPLAESAQVLAVTMAGNIALAITNLMLRETLRNQVIRDALTGLFNRRYMEETLPREIVRARRAGTRIGVIMIDIDHFKKFNDTFGHGAGDAVLREFGGYLRTKVRGSDIPCRYGGEEFTLVLPDAPADVTIRRAEELRKGVIHALTLEHQGRPLGAITLSLGVAFFPDHGETADAVLAAADAALYRAKDAGRDRVEVAETGAKNLA